jgi:hypothetical protein
MHVFLTWSGEVSKKSALALRDWLPKVIQRIQPFMSDEDIRKGSRWRTEIEKKLDSVSYGIMCLTADNLKSEWVHFEAGALAKHASESHVTALLVGVKHADVNEPLAQFQHTTATKPDVLKLMKDLNTLLKDGALPERTLEEIFEVFWPQLELKLAEALSAGPAKAPAVKSSDALLKEILEVSRTHGRLLSRLTDEQKELKDFVRRQASGYFDSPYLSGVRLLGERDSNEKPLLLGDLLMGSESALADAASKGIIDALRKRRVTSTAAADAPLPSASPAREDIDDQGK